jgi:hypothetical protein
LGLGTLVGGPRAAYLGRVSVATEDRPEAAPTRRRVTVRRVLAVLIALALSSFLMFATLVDLPGGPLGDQAGAGVAQGRLKDGDVVTFQFPTILNQSGHTIRLRSIEPRDIDPGLEILGIKIVPEPLQGRAVAQPGWPPHRRVTDTKLYDVDGYEVSSRGTGGTNESTLIVGVRYTGTGRQSIHGFRVHYRDHLLRRVNTIDDVLTLTDERNP